jgi:hypothetical protein
VKEVDASSQAIAAPEEAKDRDEDGSVTTLSQHDMNLMLKSLLRDDLSRRWIEGVVERSFAGEGHWPTAQQSLPVYH